VVEAGEACVPADSAAADSVVEAASAVAVSDASRIRHP